MTDSRPPSSNPLRSERAMFDVLLRVLAIAVVVIALATLVDSAVGVIAGLILVGAWIGVVLARRRGTGGAG